MAEAKPTIAWEALEHVYYAKTQDWYWIVGIGGVTLAVLSFILGNTILGLLFLVAIVTVMIHGAKVPKVTKVELKGDGVRFGTSFYPYREIYSFSIDEEHVPPKLILDSKALITPDVQIFIEDVTVEQVREHLLDHLDEKYHEHKLVDGLIHYLGF